ncbi:MAG: hypothetical protein Q9162_006058 [Coniocarpon cinnabarinum]
MDNQVATKSTCSNTLVKADGSNYWTPALYFQSPANKSFYSVPVDYMNVYYKFEDTPDKIVAFKPGFRMTAGNPTLRSPPPKPMLITDHAQGPIQPIEITCVHSNSVNAQKWPSKSNGMHGVGIGMPQQAGEMAPSSGSGFPNQYCDLPGAPLRLDVRFPSCYNPKAGLDSYKKNTDWPTNQKCPDGWDHLPQLTYEVYYKADMFNNDWKPGGDKQPFVLANGDPTGYSFHGDFISGWDPKVLQNLIDTCHNGDNGGGSMADCPSLTQDDVYPSASASACSIKPYNPTKEKLTGEMKELPGCNPVVGAGPAVKMGMPCKKDKGMGGGGGGGDTGGDDSDDSSGGSGGGKGGGEGEGKASAKGTGEAQGKGSGAASDNGKAEAEGEAKASGGGDGSGEASASGAGSAGSSNSKGKSSGNLGSGVAVPEIPATPPSMLTPTLTPTPLASFSPYGAKRPNPTPLADMMRRWRLERQLRNRRRKQAPKLG